MYGDQFGEFLCGYWDLKDYSLSQCSKADASSASPSSERIET